MENLPQPSRHECAICKLKTITKGDLSRKNDTSVSSRQFSRQSTKLDLTCDPLEGTSE